jgi:protein SCO1
VSVSEPTARLPSGASNHGPTNAGRSSRSLAAGRWIVLLVIGIGVAGLWATTRSSKLAARTHTANPLPVIAPVPEFSLTERGGRTVSRADLLGKVWVADFIFSNCAGPCPQLTLRMRGLQNALLPDWKDVRLVSISLDPAADRPDVLAKYAEKNGADAQRWWFLTGDDEAAVHALVQKGFLQAVARAAPDTAIVHSTYFVVVDRQGRMRAVHQGLAADSKEAILSDIATLLAEPP